MSATEEIAMIVILRGAIVLAAGEIAIRYSAWWYVARKREPHLIILPLLFGVALLCGSICAYEFQIVLIRSQAGQYRPEILMGSRFGEFVRALEFVAACFLTWPVTKLVYNHSLEKAVTDLCVRLFLMGITAAITWECAVLHYVNHVF